ncbi:zinc finger protein ZPR1-like [Diadema antillarum]|uniref:zinc finger protein ZPR1-like n=1 Tax=Diadema antillarum TaxID=105358 RepID=UPI003A8518CF
MAEKEGGNDRMVLKDLSAENYDELETTEIESLCMNCHENGMTRLLLTKIPFFKSVVISSFECDHCNYSNNEIQPASSLQPQGCTFDVEIKTVEDMDRQVVKTDSATAEIPELGFEIPAFTQKGTLTTVEGLLQRAAAGLEQDQPVRRALQPEVAAQIDAFIEKLKNVPRPFHLIIDDPTGNSFIENPFAPKPDPALKVTYYKRTSEQQKMLGFQDEEDAAAGDAGPPEDDPLVPEEVLEFNVDCQECHAPTKCRMQPIDIPFFKEVIIMAVACDSCGFKSNEVKTGGGFAEKGRRMTLKMTDTIDLSRDVLRSSTCKLIIPELDFSHEPMTTLGAKFTTLEGLLTDVKSQLSSQNPFMFGDSHQGSQMGKFMEKWEKILRGEMFVTVILEDPSGNSYLQNVYAPEDDPEMIVEDYERSEADNDMLGISDMKTENYEEPEGDGAQNGESADAAEEES